VTVSNDVLLLKTAITEETKKASAKVDDSQRTVLEKVEALFTRKLLQAGGAISGCLSIMYGIIVFLKSNGITGTALGWVALLAGFGMIALILLLTRKSH